MPLDRLAALDPRRQAAGLYDEFRTFAFKGNVVDLAVGVIIGTAFGRVVDSLVKNVLMPLVAAVPVGDQGYREWAVPVGGQSVAVGLFLAELVNFLIVAAALFVAVRKFLGWVTRMRQAEAEAATPLTKDQELLTEIRDLLRQRAG